MPLFTYPPLPSELDATRMIHILPHTERGAPVRCRLSDYAVSEGGETKHLYEALSYVWNNDEDNVINSQRIELNNQTFYVTPNLHAALVRLRNHHLDRVLWVDAICINQDDIAEKSKQIPLMRKIYAQADRVIIWLGEVFEDGDTALEYIRSLAEDKAQKEKPLNGRCSKSIGDACIKLLRRKWFRRIWVLQEAGLARCISIMCGSVQITGHAFCDGLKELDLSLPTIIYSVLHLIRGADFRSKQHFDSQGSVSIGQLIDMYRFHEASNSHDKLYALLGLSADDLRTPVLEPNYSIPWYQVFKHITKYILSRECLVKTWPGIDTAVIKGKGSILGLIVSVNEEVSKNSIQQVKVFPARAAHVLGYEECWTVQSSAESIQEGDIIFLLEGTSKPSILRMRKSHFTMITTTVVQERSKELQGLELEDFLQNSPSGNSRYSVLFTWKIPLAKKVSGQLTDGAGPAIAIAIYQEEPSERQQRLIDMVRVLNDIAMELLQSEDTERTVKRLFSQEVSGIPIIEDVVKAVAGNGYYGHRILEHLLQQREGLLISEEVVKAAAENTGFDGPETIEVLLKYRGQGLPITEKVVKAAAGNMKYGYPIVELLLQAQETNFPVSEELLMAAADNKGFNGYQIMELLLQQRGKYTPLPKAVFKIAAKNNSLYGYLIMESLLQYQGKGLPICEEVVKEAAARSNGYETIETLLKHEGESLPISEETMKAAAENQRYGHQIIELIMKYRGESLPVSEEVIKAAAGNEGLDGHKTMELLLQQRGMRPLVSESVLRAATGNEGFYGYQIMEVLFKYREESLPISEEVIKAAAENRGLNGPQIMEFLLQKRGNCFPVSESVVRAAAGNEGLDGHQLLKILFKYRGKSLPVSEEVVKVAAGNREYGYQNIDLLMRYWKESLPVSEDVTKTAAGNGGYHGHRIMELLIEHQAKYLVN
ncbi:heterokaryon incompatibility protein-domain-containing protein [Aspergillus novoparasiticus]|uniref:Heterokaryon incompatibility protein-domain-containing protein n=1 Tax=Aspergillus novoparasiticus TaxID=986946 RepID=A0A5N6F1K9_9EURO|nr:heterokaryon incompatibility protein-domain-containing protein [Aspergillus novoparasiticus]